MADEAPQNGGEIVVPESMLVQVDWLSVNGRSGMDDDFYTGSVIRFDMEDEPEWISPARASVIGSHDNRLSIQGRSDFLAMQGNPSKVAFGHNGWGTGDPYEALRLVDPVAQTNEVPWMSEDIWPHFRPAAGGLISVSRIDLCRSARYSSNQEALQFVEHMAACAHTRHKSSMSDGYRETAYFGKHSRNWSAKVYAKQREALVHQKRTQPLDKRILDWMEGVVRVEITLRGQELERALYREGVAKNALFDVDFDHRMGSSLAKRLWLTYYEKIEMGDNRVNLDALEELPVRGKSRAVFMAWAQGGDVRRLLMPGKSKSSFYYVRNLIRRKTGCDIAGSPLPADSTKFDMAIDDPRWDPRPPEGIAPEISP